MLSKEEIKKGLTEELGRTITANECGLSTNDFKKDIEILEDTIKYIEQLETDKQKLIEKLEEDIRKANSIANDNEYRYIEEVIDEQYERMKYAQEILELVKGVENENNN